jgi:hypothetical protein
MNLADINDRLAVIASINSENNKARKQVSLKQFEVMNGRLQGFVKENLEGQLYQESVREMPIVSSINVQKAIVDKKATIYKKSPKREFTETDEEQTEKLRKIYKDMKIDMKLNKANKNYIYQDQSIGMIVPKNGKLIMRVFAMHQIDAIVDPQDPESSKGFILSVFDRTNYMQLDSELKERDTATGNYGRSNRSASNSNQDELVAEKYQFQKYVAKYIVWSKEYNFMMNGLGEVIDPETGEETTDIEIVSPLLTENIMPFFEISRDKDFEYFVRSSNSLTDFTVQFNERLSDLANIQKMNGYAVAILKTPTDLKPSNLVIGNSQIIHLATDGEDGDKVDFSFTSPNSDIAGISDANDRFLNYFITSEGLGGDVVNSTGEQDKATSGIDRFIQSIQKMEAHSDDYEAFKCLEADVYKIIKAWLRVLNGSDMLDSQYQIPTLREDSEIQVQYSKPEMMETETEKLNNLEKRIELGLMTKKEALMKDRDLDDEDKAQKILDEIDNDNSFNVNVNPIEELNGTQEES